MQHPLWNHRVGYSAVLASLAVLAACASPPPPPPPVAVVAPVVVPPPPKPVAPPPVVVVEPPPALVSAATSLPDYRKDVATHLYKLHQDRIYSGQMPPLLYAVGVLQTDIDQRGQVTAVRWMRAPHHAPEVMAQIENMARAASPYPAPTKLGGVTYTETWLWHKSGRWQLHTLTEGQR